MGRWPLIGSVVIILMALLFYSLHTHFYYETMVNSDGAYVFLHMREFLLGNNFDLLHVGYRYCGLIEHLGSAILSFLLPSNWAIVYGISLFYVAGFFFLKHNFAGAKKFALALLLFFPMPNPFFQSYSALGGHTYIVFQYFVALWFLTSPRFKFEDGEYKLWAYLGAGLSGGLALYAYKLAQLLVIATVITFIVCDKKRISLRFPLKLITFVVAVGVGFLPNVLSIYFYPGKHDAGAATDLYFNVGAILLKYESLKKVVAALFSPVWSHQIELSYAFNHSNYPVFETLRSIHSLGAYFAIAIFLGVAVCFFKKQILEKSKSIDSLMLFSLLCLGAFFSGYLLRAGEYTLELESRYMLVVYFSLLVMFLYIVPARWSITVMVLLSVVSLYSHGVIFWSNQNYRDLLSKEKSCTSLTKSEVFAVLKDAGVRAVSGSYWEVWPLAAVLKTNLVDDPLKNKFYFTQELFHRYHPVVYITNANPSSNLAVQAMSEVSKRGREFVQAQIGPFLVSVETVNDLPSKISQQVISRNPNKEGCKFIKL
ncbi:MAG: hypothetical protein HQK50_05470 [Oligoflexia bacterium]|nr:hypothetical protein [Oligoflexia bacterium]